MTLAVASIQAGVDALETAQGFGTLFEIKDLGSVILHVTEAGFIAFTACGKCFVGGIYAF